jgi:hypothetical protein
MTYAELKKRAQGLAAVVNSPTASESQRAAARDELARVQQKLGAYGIDAARKMSGAQPEDDK